MGKRRLRSSWGRKNQSEEFVAYFRGVEAKKKHLLDVTYTHNLRGCLFTRSEHAVSPLLCFATFGIPALRVVCVFAAFENPAGNGGSDGRGQRGRCNSCHETREWADNDDSKWRKMEKREKKKVGYKDGLVDVRSEREKEDNISLPISIFLRSKRTRAPCYPVRSRFLWRRGSSFFCRVWAWFRGPDCSRVRAISVFVFVLFCGCCLHFFLFSFIFLFVVFVWAFFFLFFCGICVGFGSDMILLLFLMYMYICVVLCIDFSVTALNYLDFWQCGNNSSSHYHLCYL